MFDYLLGQMAKAKHSPTNSRPEQMVKQDVEKNPLAHRGQDFRAIAQHPLDASAQSPSQNGGVNG
jgi:hypothetical protein